MAYVSVYKGGRPFLRTSYRNLEIETSRLDGSDRSRLTFNTDVPEHHEEAADIAPTWLPDGSGIVFVRDRGIFDEAVQYGIYTMASDGSDERAVVHVGSPEWPDAFPDGEEIYSRWFRLTRPEASPDGKMVAFIVQENVNLPPDHPNRSDPGVRRAFYHSLYVATLDGAGLTRLFSARELPGQRVSTPAGPFDTVAVVNPSVTLSEQSVLVPAAHIWNPRIPGQLLLLVNEYREGIPTGAILYSISTDGSEPMVVANLPTQGGHLDWSPDGTRVLVSHSDPRHGFIYVVDPHSGLWSMVSMGGNASWSPDGARIAKFSTDPPAPRSHERHVTILSTMSSDGTDVRVLARTDYGDRTSWQPVEDGRLTLADRIAPCKTDDIVPHPRDNPLLVEDCETLLTIKNTFAGNLYSLNWDADTPISEWEGVTLGGSPLRVEALRLYASNFVGAFRPEFGRLTGLKSLAIGGQVVGPIPPQMGNLTELRELNLSTWPATGIPPELGNLKNLETLNLDVEHLEQSECIPSSLVSSLEVVSDAWYRFETIAEWNSSIGTDLKACPSGDR